MIHFKVRFDGLLGFPGGLVDEGESVEQGLNRELEEEINLNLDEVKITESDLISIQRPTVNDEDPNLVCYFYAKGLSGWNCWLLQSEHSSGGLGGTCL